MNTMLIFAVRDRCLGYGALMLEQNEEVAKRNFAYACSSGQMKAQAADFDLYCLGTYDISSGAINRELSPRFIISGTDASALY